MRKMTAVYICKTTQLMNETIERIILKNKDITIYNDGVLIRQTITGEKTIEIMTETDFNRFIDKTSDNVYVKSNAIDKAINYIGRVKGIVIPNNAETLSNIKNIPNKKMIEVGYL